MTSLSTKPASIWQGRAIRLWLVPAHRLQLDWAIWLCQDFEVQPQQRKTNRLITHRENLVYTTYVAFWNVVQFFLTKWGFNKMDETLKTVLQMHTVFIMTVRKLIPSSLIHNKGVIHKWLVLSSAWHSTWDMSYLGDMPPREVSSGLLMAASYAIQMAYCICHRSNGWDINIIWVT